MLFGRLEGVCTCVESHTNERGRKGRRGCYRKQRGREGVENRQIVTVEEGGGTLAGYST